MRSWLLGVILTLAAGALTLGTGACGGRPPQPKQGVIQADVGTWKYRRFQAVVDVEVWVANNKAQGFTASYIDEAAEKRAHCCDDKDVVNAFVTRYEKDDGVLRALVKYVRRLAAEDGYQVEEDKIKGTRALRLVGHGETWVMWAAKQHVIKVGGRGRESVPDGLVATYADRYPSVVPGGVLEGPLPAGPEDQPKKEKEEYDPNAPRPDLDKYDPKKAKLPDKKPEK
jgi:hypothetical protein